MYSTLFLASLGCNKNLVDSEVMVGKLIPSGITLTSDPAEADLIVVNTCAFVGDAKHESIDSILDLIEYKKHEVGSCECFVVTGCLSQRYIKELEKELPEVDIFLGTGEYQNIFDAINRYHDEKKRISLVGFPTFIHKENDLRVNLTYSYSQSLKIADGCDRRCTFCIIPEIRGNMRSRTVDSLVTEAKKLVNNGAVELNLIAQDLSSYGKDLSGQNNLLLLLQELEKINDLRWIRLMYYYPDDLDDKMIDFIMNSKKVCHYLDIPVQHFSSQVLKRMGRKITGPEIISKLLRLRAKIPNIVLRTSMIVGFPGESERDFKELLSGVNEIKFDYLGAFKYSLEEGTPAEKLKERVGQDLIDERYDKLYEIQQNISYKRNCYYVGRTIEVLIEGHHADTDLLIVGRHKMQAAEIDGQVIINEIANNITPQIGSFVNVLITEAHDYDLVGKIV